MSDNEKTVTFATEEKRPKPKYKHKDGKCDIQCTFYENGYCKITSEYMRHTPMMGPKKDLDCQPYLIDLRRDSKKNHPEYHDTKDLDAVETFEKFCNVMDDSGEIIERIDITLQEILDELRGKKR